MQRKAAERRERPGPSHRLERVLSGHRVFPRLGGNRALRAQAAKSSMLQGPGTSVTMFLTTAGSSGSVWDRQPRVCAPSPHSSPLHHWPQTYPTSPWLSRSSAALQSSLPRGLLFKLASLELSDRLPRASPCSPTAPSPQPSLHNLQSLHSGTVSPSPPPPGGPSLCKKLCGEQEKELTLLHLQSLGEALGEDRAQPQLTSG